MAFLKAFFCICWAVASQSQTCDIIAGVSWLLYCTW